MQQALSDMRKPIIRYLHRMDAKKIVSDGAPNARYSSWDVLKTIVLAAMWGTFVESTVQKLKNIWMVIVPSGDVVFTRLKNTLKMTGFENMLILSRDINRQAKRRGWFRRRLTVAIDYWDREYYGKNRDVNCSAGKRKNGTTFFHRIATLCIVEDGLRFEIAMMPVKLFARKEIIVKSLLTEALKFIKIKAVLLDRGFNSVPVIRAIEEMNLKYIMPMQKNKRIMRLIKESLGLWFKVIPRYQFRLRTNLYVRLLLVDSELIDGKTQGTFLAYITNIMVESNKGSILTIVKKYEDRWGIETGYRVKKWEFLAKTCSESQEVRFFLIMLSIILFNIWTLLRTVSRKLYDTELTAYMFKEVFVKETLLPAT